MTGDGHTKASDFGTAGTFCAFGQSHGEPTKGRGFGDLRDRNGFGFSLFEFRFEKRTSPTGIRRDVKLRRFAPNGG